MNAKGFSVGEIYKVGDRLAWIQDVLGLQPAPATPPAPPTPPPAASNGSTSTPPPQPTPSPSPNGGTNTQPSPTTSTGTSTLAPPQPVPTPPPPTPSAPSVYYTLVNPTKLLPATIPDKIVKIYKELQIVHVSGQRGAAPHAVGALLRILVEITAQEYLMQKHGFRHDSG